MPEYDTGTFYQRVAMIKRISDWLRRSDIVTVKAGREIRHVFKKLRFIDFHWLSKPRLTYRIHS